MRFLSGLFVGCIVTIILLTGSKVAMVTEPQTEKLGEVVLDYTFYENLFDTSVTVLEGVYDQEVNHPEAGKIGAGPSIYFVQLGSFSRKESADVFRAKVILEGYMTSDIAVESADSYHRVALGPFAHRGGESCYGMGRKVLE